MLDPADPSANAQPQAAEARLQVHIPAASIRGGTQDLGRITISLLSVVHSHLLRFKSTPVHYNFKRGQIPLLCS
jgi:hypothetical protein